MKDSFAVVIDGIDFKSESGHINNMTLNVPINQQGVPMGLPMEQFLVYRADIEFLVEIDNLGKKELKGTAYLTTHRIIFVSRQPTPDFQSFDIPIATLFNEDVKFPLFGSTYLKGSTPPNQNLLPGYCHFKLWFYKGGVDTFVRCLDKCIKEVRRFNNNMEAFVQNSGMYNDARSGRFQQQAYVDPNDPSKVFMQQPSH